MANFFDKLNANLTNAGRTVSQKVKNSSDASRLMNEITLENRKIQANLNAIGKLYYDLFRKNPDDDFLELVESVARSEQRIMELQESVRVIRSRTPELVPVPDNQNGSVMICTGCGNTYGEGQVFCSVCGQKLVPQYQKPNPSAMVCMGCGNTYGEGQVFCSVCGQKLVPQYQNAAAAASAPGQTAEDVQVRPEEDPITADPDEIIVDAEIVEEVKFCPHCGKKLSLTGQAFCDQCGYAVS